MKHVLVGAGPASLAALETLRALDGSAELTIVCDEPPYSRMVLPYFLSGRIEERGVSTGSDAWLESLGARTRFGRRVTAVEPRARNVRLDDGSAIEYDRLLLATGSRATRPPIPGADGPGVVNLWTLDDARAFLAAPHGEVVIVGAGFIAFTILDAVAKRARRVTLLELEPRILPRMLDAPSAALLEAQLAAHGIEIRTRERLERIEAAGGRQHLVLSGREAIECDAVIFATGIAPNVECLAGSGIAVEHGILVDAHLRTSAPDVFAAGDVAQGPDLLSKERRVQAIQPVAVDHGRVAAANMAGSRVAYSGSLTMNVLAAQGLEAASFGRWEEEGDVTRVANTANRIYRKYVWEDDRLVGGIFVGPTLAVSAVNDLGMLKGLIQTGVRLGPWRAYLEENPLDLRRAFVASGAAPALLESTLLAGRASAGGGFRFPSLPARRARSPHHATFLSGLER